MHYSKDLNYMDGRSDGRAMAANIESTLFKTLDTAIEAKQNLINHFEEQFGYTHDQETFDRNYTYNLGLLDELKEAKKRAT